MESFAPTVAEQAAAEMAESHQIISRPVRISDLANDHSLQQRFHGAMAKRAERPDLGNKPKMRWLHVEDLWVDETYQRLLRVDHALKIALDFDWAKFQSLSVTQRGKGKEAQYFLTDGQHKAVAVMLLGISEVPCLVYTGETVRDEAEQFFGINNNRRAVPLVVKHRNAVLLENRAALELQDVINRAGLILVEGRPNKAGEFNNLSALRTALRKGSDASVLRAADFIRQVWPEEPINGTVMLAVTVFLTLYGNNKQYRDDMLIKTLQSYETQDMIMVEVDIRRSGSKVVRENIIVSDLVDQYNKVNRRRGTSVLSRTPIESILVRRSPNQAFLTKAAQQDPDYQDPLLPLTDTDQAAD